MTTAVERTRRRPGRRPRLSEEGAFTLVELLVAMFLTTTGLLAVAGTLDMSRELVSTSERKEAVTHVGEREIEQLLALDEASLALTAVPSYNADEDDPDHHVTATTPATYKWDNRNTASAAERFALSAAGVAPQESWSDGRLSGKVHRYVTCVSDAAVTAKVVPTGCPAASGYDYKRVTVAVTVSDGDPRTPTVFSSVVIPES